MKITYAIKTLHYMTPQTHPLGWGGKFSEIPAVIVIVARMRLVA